MIEWVVAMSSNEMQSGRPPVERAAASFWETVRAALRGGEQDYTSGPVGRAVILLAIPMVLEMAMESVFVIVDIFFVARLGADVIAAVGLTEAVLTLLYAVGIGLAMGTTAMVARRIGEKDVGAANVVAAQTVWIGLVLSIAIGIAGIRYASEILTLMGGEARAIEQGSAYTAIMLGGAVTILSLFLLNAVFRGAGDAVTAMRALWLANGINVVLDPCLIFGLGPFPEMGVAGAAVATNIGRGVGMAFLIYRLVAGRSGITLTLATCRVNLDVMRRLLRVSIGGVLQFLIATSSYLFLMRIVARYGSQAVAGITIGIRIFAFTFLPAWGLGNAAATLVGQNLGAGKPERAEESVWQAVRYNVAFLVCVSIIFILFGRSLAGIFTTDPVVLDAAAGCLKIISYSYGFYAVGMILTQAFNGAGDTDTPTLINFACLWVLQLPLAYMLANAWSLGPLGVYVAIAVADSLVAIVAIRVFRRGRWKLREL